jgi:hypothetical protein
MKKLIGILLLCIFIICFVFGTLVTAAPPNCLTACINGTWYMCCPDGHGGWICGWDGRC